MGRLSEYDDLEQSIINDASNRMRDEIDFQILSGMLCEMGWTKVILNPMTTERSNNIDRWVKDNIKHPFQNMGLVWIFEHKADASWFVLKWI